MSVSHVLTQAMTSKEEASFRIMRMIEQNPKISQRELADATGVSLGKAHYLLRALLERGYVKLENFSASPKKRGYAYILTPRGVARKAALTTRFLSRKLEEFEALRNEIEELSIEIGGIE